MSIALPTVDLSSYAVGQQGSIDLSHAGPDANPAFTKNKPQVILYNESGSGLQVFFQKGVDQHIVPAGAWVQLSVEPGEQKIFFVVLYNLPNPPVSKLAAVYFAPGESPPPLLILGNSPIGIGGSVNVSSVQTLSNEGAGSNLLVIDTGDSVFNQLYTFYNDGHCLWAVDQAGVKHQVIKVQTTGNPLQLGQAGDNTEVLGNLAVDGTFAVTSTATLSGVLSLLSNLSVLGTTSLDSGNITTDGTGHLTIPNNIAVRAKTTGGTPQNIMYVDISNGTNLQAAALGNIVYIDDQDTSTIAQFSKGVGLEMVAGQGITIDNPGFLNIANTGASSNGSVSGTATIFFPIWGNGLKIFVLSLVNYNSVSHTFSFPTSTNNGFFAVGNIASTPSFSLQNSGVAQTLSIITALGGTGAGTSIGSTTVHANSIGQLVSTANQVFVANTGGGALTATMIYIGV